MISSAKSATPVSSNVPGTPATVSPDSTGTPFDAILALETVAATATSPQAALDLSTVVDPGNVAELPEDLLAEGDDADADDGDDAADDPLAFLAALLAYPATTPAPAPATAASAAASGAGGEMLEGIEDSLASAGKHGGQAAPDAAPDPVATNSATTADPKALDASLTGKLIDAISPEAAPANDGTADATRVDPANPRAAEWLAHAPRHAANEHAPIATPARDPRWADDFSTRIAMLVRGGESSASLQLTPVDLGPMEVNITVRDSQATIQFGAAQADTRALIENSIPRLREMLAAQGFQLMDASVSQGITRQTRPEIPGVSRGQADEPEVAAVTTRVPLRGLLDTYA